MEVAPTGDAGGAFVQLLGGAPAVLVVAHPDDETIGLGGHLGSLPGLSVLHLTNGAPHDPAFARAAGLATPEEYAEARARELDRAMDIAGVDASRRRSLALPDQEASEHLVAIARAVRVLVRASAARVVPTHAYEGGHPDHDGAAAASRRRASLRDPRVADDGRPAVRARGGGPARPRAGVETWLEH